MTRHPERARRERAELDALLDEILVGTLSTVVDGWPRVVPLFFARDGDRVLVHGSTGAGALRHVAAGAPAALCVVALDGVVVAHSTFASSANYRSAVLHGTLDVIPEEDQARALGRISDRLIPGRTGEVPPSSAKELAATLVLSLPIEDGRWVLKVRTGQASEPDEPTDAWSGVVPLRLVAGDPQPASRSLDQPVPASVGRLVARHQPPGPVHRAPQTRDLVAVAQTATEPPDVPEEAPPADGAEGGR